MKTPYTSQVPTQNGPRLTNAKSSIDELLSPKYANKGKFSETERKTLQLTNQNLTGFMKGVCHNSKSVKKKLET
ncbi:unnamed protein product [Trichobilharzia regenti]|nr:unnamed protein product [Trichobilharzia regenti]